MTDITPDALEGEIRAKLEEIAEGYSRAEVDVTSGPKRPTIVTLSCRAPLTAAISILPDPSQIDVSIGRAAHFEVLGEVGVISDVLDELADIATAVAEGRLQETVWEIGNYVVRSNAVIRQADGRASQIARGVTPLALLIGRKRSIRYRSYD